MFLGKRDYQGDLGQPAARWVYQQERPYCGYSWNSGGNLDYIFMNLSIWKWIVILFWMGMASGIVIGLSLFFNIPDEIAGPLLFIGIGIAVSTALNYYREKDSTSVK